MKPQGTETYENISYGYAAYTCKPVYHRCRLVRRKSGGSCIFLDEDNRPRKVTAYYAATLGNGFVRIDPQTGLLADWTIDTYTHIALLKMEIARLKKLQVYLEKLAKAELEGG